MKILLADDEPIARTMLEHWLAGWGYTVISVKDGEQALNALRADSHVRMAILDWVMPNRDGIQVCREIRGGPPEPYIYIVLLTARDDKADIVQGLDAGADDYLVKPCNPLELKVRLRAGKRVVELQEQLVSARETMRFEAMHDSLTQMLNRKAVIEQLDREVMRSARRNMPVSVILLDIDHFKTVNDQYGHPIGDAVLREASARIKSGIRAYDTAGRVGGEEFLVVLPECDERLGLVVAHRIENLLSSTPFTTPAGTIKISASLGVAATSQFPSAAADDLVRAADAALYQAKGYGRARTVLASTKEWTDSVRRPERISQPAPV